MCQGRKWRFYGSITVETALVMPIVIIIIISTIKFAYRLHDNIIVSMLDKYKSVKGRMIDWNYYDVQRQQIDTKAIANKPLVELELDYKEYQHGILEARILDYENVLVLGETYIMQSSEWVCGIKNSTVVRTTHILLNHVERIKYD